MVKQICLIADVGGTNVRFSLYSPGAEPYAFEKLKCDDYKDLGDAANSFLEAHADLERPSVALFAVAGPLDNIERVDLTNRDWSFSPKTLRQTLGMASLTVVNDFMALAMAAPRIPEQSLRGINGGHPQAGAPIVVMGPGTGLGISAAVPHDHKWIPISSEGGHVTFSPSNEEEEKVVHVLQASLGHVSPERLLSGPGLVNVYRAMATLRQKERKFSDPSQITQAALEGSCSIARGALDLFFGALGTVAANMCLTFCARGGVYIGGGIVPKVYDLFVQSSFRQRFESMGRFREYLSGVPIYLIVEKASAFRGLSAMVDDDYYPSGVIRVSKAEGR